MQPAEKNAHVQMGLSEPEAGLQQGDSWVPIAQASASSRLGRPGTGKLLHLAGEVS